MTGTSLDQFFTVCEFMESVNVNTSAMIGDMSAKDERRLSHFKNRRAGDAHANPLQKGNKKSDDGKKQMRIQGGEILRHFCKICKRRFACGRALGGHMRIHGHKSNPRLVSREAQIMNGWCESVEDVTDLTPNNQTPDPMYALRTNRKRSWVVADQSYSFQTPSSSVSEDQLIDGSTFLFTNSQGCDECGKEFSSWKALFAHMKSTHCSNPNGDSDCLEKEEEEMLEMEIQPRVKGKRSKRMRCSQRDELQHSHSPLSHYSEEEDMANCLVMLATAGKSSSLETPTKAIQRETTASELNDRRANSSTDPCDSIDRSKTNDKVLCSFQALHRASHSNNYSGKDGSSSEDEIVTNDEDKFKLAEVQIQHRHSHKFQDEANLVLQEKKKSNEEENDESISASASARKERVHKCSICERKFASGQALGGHKRCHRAATLHKTVEEKRGLSHEGELIDLNLPAPGHDDEYEAVAAPNNVVNKILTEINYCKGSFPCYSQPWWSGHNQKDIYFPLPEQTQAHVNVVAGRDDKA